MQDCPECFGKPSKSGRLPGCPDCRYRESCAFCANDDGSSCNRRSGHVSYDRYSYSREVAAEPQVPEDCESLGEGDNASTQRVLEFLLDLDNYSAELLHEVLHGEANTASDLARKFGVSRQAVHRKIVDCCTLHPELRKLFISRLYRCRRLLRDSDRIKEPEPDNTGQMEFDFTNGIVEQGFSDRQLGARS